MDIVGSDGTHPIATDRPDSTIDATPTDEPGASAARHRSGSDRTVMADVAEAAGVSMMTVSRVINGTARVREATRERVLSAMEELDYQINTAARALATGRSRRLGVVAYNTTLFGPASTVFAIEHTARAAGYETSVVTVAELDAPSLQDAVDRLRQQNVDGLVVMAPTSDAVEAVLALGTPMPLVTVQGGAVDGSAAVAIDHADGARRATEHLLSLGHATVWHLAGPEEWIEAGLRRQAWRETLEQAGAEPPPVLRGDWSARSGYELGMELLGRPGEVTAVFSANDQMALGLYRAADERGVDVPRELSVVGFDDIPEAAYYAPPLTTVRQDFRTVGASSLTMLLERLDGTATVESLVTVDAELVERRSTAPPG